MILTCPECATSYFVDDLRIPRLGRMVKCTNCGHRWRAHQDRAEPEPTVAARPDDDLLVEGPPLEPPPPDDDLEFVAAPVTPVRKPEPPRKASPVLTIVASAMVGIVLAGGAIVLLRQQVVGLLPATAPMFAAIGLPVNTSGLVLQASKATPMLQGGQPVWSVTGAVRNVREEAVIAPPIRLTLLDRAGKPLATMVVQPQNNRVPPGATRYFAITMPNPPSGGATMQVDLEAAHEAEPTVAEHKAALSEAPATAAVEAQPLSPDSPDALEKHEQH